MEDRFGDNGVVSVVIGAIKGDICHIELRTKRKRCFTDRAVADELQSPETGYGICYDG